MSEDLKERLIHAINNIRKDLNDTKNDDSKFDYVVDFYRDLLKDLNMSFFCEQPK